MNFETEYMKTLPTIKRFAKKFSKATNIPPEEYESAMCEEFSKKYFKYDGRISFSAFIKPILNQCASRVAERKERKFYDNVLHVDGIQDDEGNATFEFVDENDVEKLALDRIEKGSDKLSLIQALVKDADEFTVVAVKLILEKPNASLNSIAKEMSVHPQTLSRKITRLARNYDQSRFGDLAQYLAV